MTWKVYRHPAEPAGPAEEAGEAQQADKPVYEQPPPPDDGLVRLQRELTEAKAESEQWRDRFLRKAAEFENYRKRIEKEKVESSFLARSSVLSEFLPFMDACERAQQSLPTQESDEKVERYRQGVQLLYKQIGDILNRVGVEAMKAEGQPFDPNFHEAVSRQASPRHADNTVLHELRRGYLFQGRLLRAAQVVVSSRPVEDKPEGA